MTLDLLWMVGEIEVIEEVSATQVLSNHPNQHRVVSMADP